MKSVKHAPFASEETQCYSASLCIDGKKIGTVSNAGHGGCDLFHGDRDAYQRADDWCQANLPKWTLEGDGKEMDTDLEYHCGTLLDRWFTERTYRRQIKTSVMMIEGGALYGVKHRGAVEQTIAWVRKNHPTALVLNTLPTSDAAVLIGTVGDSG